MHMRTVQAAVGNGRFKPRCMLGWLLILSAVAVYGQAPSFNRTDVRLDMVGPEGITFGDFNNDGKADIAIANARSHNVSILINQGDGSLRAFMVYPVGQKPVAIITEDLNGDNNLDLVIANEESNDISILLGNGDGTFRNAMSYPTGRGARAVVASDFNNDRIPDLAVANNDGSSVTILLGNGDGTFRVVTSLSTQHPYGITAGDYNRDGNMDIAVANIDLDRVTLFWGRGDGTFNEPSSFPAGGRPTALVTADFDRDGNPDLAVADSGDDGIAVLLGNGRGGFAPFVRYETGDHPRYLAVGDFNLDDIPDLTISNLEEGTISVLTGVGNGTFTEGEDFNVGDGAAAIAVGDLFSNGAGLDIVVALSQDNVITIFQNNNRYFPCSPAALHFAQFANGDGVTSMLTLVNPSMTAVARGEVELFNDQGNGLALSLNGEPFASRKRFAIPPRGTQSLVTSGRGALQAGATRVCTRDAIGGVVLFKVPGVGTTGVGQSNPFSAFLSPVERNSGTGLDTGVAVSNVSGSVVTLNLVLRGLNGATVATASQTLLGNGHLARFITDLFGASVPDRFAGTLEVTATGGPIAATALRFGGGQFTTLPVTPMP